MITVCYLRVYGIRYKSEWTDTFYRLFVGEWTEAIYIAFWLAKPFAIRDIFRRLAKGFAIVAGFFLPFNSERFLYWSYNKVTS